MLFNSLPLGRPTRCLLGSFQRDKSGAQVLGTAVPSYANFPYQYREILYLYKSFLKLIYLGHPPEERRDLLFRLRNEFQSKRHLSGRKVIAAAVRRGEGILALQKQMLDREHMRRRRPQLDPRRGQKNGGSTENETASAASWRGNSTETGGADSVDTLWEQLQYVSNNVVPGLNNSRSVGLSEGSYTRQATTQNVYSRRQ